MDWKPLLQNKWLLVLGLLGIACLLLGTFWGSEGRTVASMAGVSGAAPTQASPAPPAVQDSAPVSARDLESQYDQRLTSMLKKIKGIHDVSVMVTLESTETLQVANNVRRQTQTQTSGGQTTSSSTTEDDQVFTQRTSSGDNEPFVVQRVQPKVRGVLVTVSADDFYAAKAEIIDAIRNVLDVPAYKISVEPQ